MPPVVLTRRGQVRPDEAQLACVSLVMFPRQWSWFELAPWIEEPARHVRAECASFRKLLPAAAAAGLAFDTWVDQRDHAGSPDNVVFGTTTECESSAVMFLDYEQSLGCERRWRTPEQRRACHPAAFFAPMLRLVDRDALGAFVTAIEAVPARVIEEIVGRVPADFLPPDEAGIIRDALLQRQELVRPALQGYLEGSGS